MAEWIGCGPSAASQFAGERYCRPASLDEWVAGMASDEPPKADQVQLDAAMLMVDAIVFGLRMNVGIDLDDILQRFQAPDLMSRFDSLLDRFSGEGLLTREGSWVRLTHQGRLVCDAIGSMILEHANV